MMTLIVISAGISYFLSLPFAALLQGANYRVDTYFRRGVRWVSVCAAYCFLATAALVVTDLFCDWLLRRLILLIAYCMSGAFTYVLHKKMRMHLTVTNRLVRLLVLSILLYSLLFFPLYFLEMDQLWSVLPALGPFVLILSQAAIAPFEKMNNERYLNKAKKTLDETCAIKIGITGSYGKTTVKNDLEQLLSVGFKTLATPLNYNTPLGIAKTLDLCDGREEILILEMGARRIGDIKQLCELVTPNIGVITGIAPQHLETFGSIDAILLEKNELAASIAPDDVVYYNLTDDLVRKLYDERIGKKVGIGFERSDRTILDVSSSEVGSSFVLDTGKERISLFAPVFGNAAIVDLAIACVIALDLGVSAESLSERVQTILPTAHRFEVVKKGGVTIIDDSYNSNPIGAASALASLSRFSAERKLVYVSGIVELGSATEKENRALGAAIAESADMAIVAGGRYGDMVIDGILDVDPSFAVIRVEDTAEATATFGQLLREGDLLLIMSDLPRDYLI